MPQKGLSAIFLILAIVIILIVGGVWFLNSKKDNPDQLIQRSEKNVESGQSANLSNPASEYCIKVGGDLQSQTRGDGGEYSLCNFAEGKSCEEWALYRRQCPLGGINTIGFRTKEEAYCALIGGKTTAEPDANCKLPSGKSCSNINLYNGKCQ